MDTRRQIGLTDIRHGRAPKRRPLLAPLRYLQIEAATKAKYDFVLPASIGGMLLMAYNIAQPNLEVFGPNGFLIDIQGLLQMAVPFLIGALATVAMASPGDSIDRRLVGSPVTLYGATLSTRQFVCYLLGYLSFLGFLLLLLIIGVKAMRGHMTGLPPIPSWAIMLMEQFAAATFFVLLASFCVTTFWSLFFLTDVVNRRS